MKRLLTQPFLLMVTAFGLLATGCKTETKTITSPEVAVELVNTPNATDMTVTFTPTAGTDKYMFGIGGDEDKTSFLEKILPGSQTIQGDKPTTFTFTDLEPETYYTIYAVGYDADGNAGAVAMPIYNTYSASFNVSTYYLTDNTAGFRINTTDDFKTFYYYLGKPGDKEEFENNNIEGITQKSETFKWIQNYFSLEPDTEYVFYARGIDRTNKETKTFEIPVKTKSLGSNEIPNIKFEVKSTDFYKQNYTVTPNDKCGMVLLYQYRQADYNELFVGEGIAGDIMGMINDWNRVDDGSLEYMKCYTAIGETLEADPFTKELAVDVPLGIFVIVYDQNLKPYALKQFSNQIPAIDRTIPTNNLGGTIKVTNPTYTTIDLDIALNSNTLAGFFDIYDGEALDTQMAKPEFDEYSTIQNELFSLKNQSGYFLYKNSYPAFKDTLEDEMMLPGKKYYVVLAPMNANGPYEGGWGKLVLSEPFYTPDAE